jgi:hypothetical protein
VKRNNNLIFYSGYKMVKFIKGCYLLTVQELDELLKLYNQKQFVVHAGKQYLQVTIKPKSSAPTLDNLKREIKLAMSKRQLCAALGTTYFKLDKFCDEEFGCTDFDVLKRRSERDEL